MRFRVIKFLIIATVVVGVVWTADVVCSFWGINPAVVVKDGVVYADPWIIQRFPCLGVFLPNAFWNWLSDLGLIAPTLAKLRSLH